MALNTKDFELLREVVHEKFERNLHVTSSPLERLEERIDELKISSLARIAELKTASLNS